MASRVKPVAKRVLLRILHFSVSVGRTIDGAGVLFFFFWFSGVYGCTYNSRPVRGGTRRPYGAVISASLFPVTAIATAEYGTTISRAEIARRGPEERRRCVFTEKTRCARRLDAFVYAVDRTR